MEGMRRASDSSGEAHEQGRDEDGERDERGGEREDLGVVEHEEVGDSHLLESVRRRSHAQSHAGRAIEFASRCKRRWRSEHVPIP